MGFAFKPRIDSASAQYALYTVLTLQCRLCTETARNLQAATQATSDPFGGYSTNTLTLKSSEERQLSNALLS